MSTAIEWTEETWNPTTGCDRISAGCDNCYALTLAKRLKGMGSAKYQTDGDPRTSGPGFGLAVHPDALTIPLKWRKPRTVFVNSMSDLFHARVPREFIAQVFAVMAATPQHTYQVLTKRPGRMRAFLTGVPRDEDGVPETGSGWLPGSGATWMVRDEVERLDRFADLRLTDEQWGIVQNGIDVDLPLPNVWLGTSIESDEHARRAEHLRNTPAAVRFISAEPLLGPLPSLDLTGIDWLIAGGESGPGARPMNPAWVRDLRDRCQAAGTAFFFKQWGNWVAPSQMPEDTFMSWDVENGTSAYDHDQPWHVGKKRAGRQLDGRTWDQYPAAAEQATA